MQPSKGVEGLSSKQIRDQIEGHLSRSRLAKVFLDSPSFMAVTRGPGHVFVHANPRYRELVGERELMSRTAEEAFPDLKGQGFFEALDRVYETGQPWKGTDEPVQLRPQGSEEQKTVHVCCSYHPLRDEAGAVCGILHHGIDVTERVELRRQLQRRISQQDEVADFGRSALSAGSVPALLQDAVEMARHLLEADVSTLYRAQEGVLVPRERSGEQLLRSGARNLSLHGQSPAARAFRQEEAVLLRTPADQGLGDEMSRRLAVPVPGADGEPHGVLDVRARDVGAFDEEDVSVLRAVVQIVGTAISRQEQLRFRETAVQNLPGFLYRCRNDRDWTMEFLSDGVREVTGYQSKELSGEGGLGYADIIHPDDRDRVRDEVQAAVLEDRSFDVQYRIETGGGEVRWVWEQGCGVRPAPGESLRLEGFVFDVTDARRTREELGQTRELFTNLFDISPVALEIIDGETHEYLNVNDVFTEQLGYTRKDIESGSVRETDLWLDSAARDRIYDRVAEGGTVRNAEVELRRKDGSTFEALFSASAFAKNGGDGAEYVVGAIQDISYLKEVEYELRERALYDHLTGLPNRALLDDRLQQALERCERSGETLAVLFVDLKRFKVINDSLGHDAGDRVLEAVAERLRRAVRKQDTVARIGGDEFTVLLEKIESEADAMAGATRVVDAFGDPVEVGVRQVPVDASVGVAVHDGGTGRPAPTDLLQCADEAMYRARSKPGSASALARCDGPATGEARLEREARLRSAIEGQQIDTAFQPIVAAEDSEPRAVEALARWHDPELGQVAPSTFIPLAEETGLIVELGKQMMEEACRSLVDEERLGGVHGANPLRLHVNLSSRQLEHPQLVEQVKGVLERTKYPANRLCLEVTESAAAREADVIDRLRDLGVSIAIDDFGTGYATLGQLKRLRVDALKIDRSFVENLLESRRDQAIVESVLTLGHRLGLMIVAEGLEASASAEFLRESGVDELQGYCLARPMGARELRAWLRSNSHA